MIGSKMRLAVGRRVGKKCSREDKRGPLSKWIYGKSDREYGRAGAWDDSQTSDLGDLTKGPFTQVETSGWEQSQRRKHDVCSCRSVQMEISRRQARLYVGLEGKGQLELEHGVGKSTHYCLVC